MFLAGRGALLNNLPEYLSQSQSLNIDYFDPLKSLVIDDAVNQDMRALLPFMIGEPVGLATAVLNVGGNNALKRPLNLLPANKLTSLGFKKKVPLLILAALLFSLLPVPNILKQTSTEKGLERELAQLKNASSDLSDEVEQKENLKKKFLFTEKLNKLVFERNFIFRQKSFSCWVLQDFLNQLQSSLDHPDVSDTWFDELKFDELAENQTTKNNRNSLAKKNVMFKVILTGRYLVRAKEEFSESNISEKRNHLIELNSKKQEALTQYLEGLPFIEKVDKKTFSIEGKGDLFERYFTHFQYVFTPKT